MRYVSIDILRTVAIVLMVLVHFIENLSGSDWAPAGLGAPLFTFLVGVSYRLWLDSQETRGVSETDISKISIRRGLFLFGLGFMFNVLVWLPEDTYNWDVLTIIGASLLLLNVARNVPLPISVLIAVLAILVAPVLRQLAEYDLYWINGYFECDLTLPDVLTGFFATGYFPLLPWVAYPLAGYVTAALVFAEPSEPGPTGRVAITGGVLVVASVFTLLAQPHATGPFATYVPTGWTMFPPSLAYVLGTLGSAMLLFALLHRWVDRHPTLANSNALKVVFTTFSKYSLSIYLLHHVAHLWPMWIYGASQGQEPTHFWRNAMPSSLAVVLAILFLLCSFFLFRWMDRTERRGVEGWMRYLCG
ncbi:MAG: hypothetical protein C0467_28470 [Planctomycetaceae bacterium]|nr:hypothetical protein [Planctomycetaceae bacterium]